MQHYNLAYFSYQIYRVEMQNAAPEVAPTVQDCEMLQPGRRTKDPGRGNRQRKINDTQKPSGRFSFLIKTTVKQSFCQHAPP